MAAAGLICGLLYVLLFAHKYKKDIEDAAYMYVCGFLCCGIGAKVLYILVSFRQIIEDIKTYGAVKAAVSHIQGGLVFYGGLLGAIAGAFITARFLKRDIHEYYPALVPAVAIMAGLGRIGCHLTGCCYGAKTDSHLCVIFPEGGIAPAGVPLVPVQLYEAVFEGVAVVALTLLPILAPKLIRYMLAIYVGTYAVFRFILEFWRADDARGSWGPFSTSQWISLALIAFLLIKTLSDARRADGKI